MATTADLAKMLEATPLNLESTDSDAAWKKAEADRVASHDKKMQNMFQVKNNVTTQVDQPNETPVVGANNKRTAVNTSGLINALAREKINREQKVRNKVSLEEKKKLMKARRTMTREEYNKVAKEYSEKHFKRKNDEVGGVYVGDPAGDTGTFQTLMHELQTGVDTGRMSSEQGANLKNALSKAESMIGRMSKSQKSMFQSMMSTQGLSQFINLPKQRPVTQLDVNASTTTTTTNTNNNKSSDDKTARQRKNRKKREKYRLKQQQLRKKEEEAKNTTETQQKEKQQQECPKSST